MPELRETRRKVKIALISMAVVDVATVVVFFSPLVGSASSRREQLSQLWKELQAKTREVEPLRGLDKKIPVARKQIDTFYKERLPSADSAISEEIGKLATESGVKIGTIKSVWKDPESVGVRQVEVEADLAGDYLQLVRFVNSIERDQLFFLVDSVALGGEQAGVVKLQIKLETYLKTGTGTA